MKELTWLKRRERVVKMIVKYQSGNLALTNKDEEIMWAEFHDMQKACPHTHQYRDSGSDYRPEPLGPDVRYEYDYIGCLDCGMELHDFKSQNKTHYQRSYPEDANRYDPETQKTGERIHIALDWKPRFHGDTPVYVSHHEYYRAKYPPLPEKPTVQDTFESLLDRVTG